VARINWKRRKLHRVALIAAATLVLFGLGEGMPETPAPIYPVRLEQIQLTAGPPLKAGDDTDRAHPSPATSGDTEAERGSARTGPLDTIPAQNVDLAKTYDMVAFTWDHDTSQDHGKVPQDHADHDTATPVVQLRASRDGLAWSDWYTLDEIDGPDPSSTEASRGKMLALGPAYLGPFSKLEIRWRGPDGRGDPPTLVVLDVSGHSASLPTKIAAYLKAALRSPQSFSSAGEARASSPQPEIITRQQWGADESLRRGEPEYGKVRAAVIHHTVSTNSYSASESAAIVRGIYQFHVLTNGWNDIGYNFLIDRYGQIFEGRAGGIDKPVIGAHSWGSNSQTTGIAIIGDFSYSSLPSPAYDALVRLLDWKLDVHSVDPTARVQFVRADGVPLDIRAVSGHRDAFPTSCPGDGLYSRLDSAAAQARDRGGQKIFGLTWTPETLEWGVSSYRPVRLSGYLKYPAEWRVRILDPGGASIASFGGSGATIDITWNAKYPDGQNLLFGTYEAVVETPGARTYTVPIQTSGGPRFEQWFLTYNPGDTTAIVSFSLSDNSGEFARPSFEVPPKARHTFFVNSVAAGKEISARVASDRPVVTERAMYFNYKGSFDGGNAQPGARNPATQWYFAEGYTAPGFEEYITLYNPSDTYADSTIEYSFNPQGSQRQQVRVPPKTRATIFVNAVVGPDREVSARVSSSIPIVAERPQYFTYRGMKGGDVVLGALEPSTEWVFAEGYTGGGFDTYLTLFNPGDTDAGVTVEFFSNRGLLKRLTGVSVKSKGRTTVRVDDHVGPDVEVSSRIVSTVPIVAERPVYFGYRMGATSIDGGHVALGATSGRSSYFFAEGYTGTGFDEYLTLLNPNGHSITVQATYAFPAAPPKVKSYDLPGRARVTIPVHAEVERAGDVSVALSSTDIFYAERPMYFVYKGAWRGGSNVRGGVEPSTAWYFAEGYTGS
jgi:hypothetical protein